MFLGTHAPKQDEKGRLFLPAKYRDELSGGVVITKGQERCLYVFPIAEFTRITEALREAPVTAKRIRTPTPKRRCCQGSCEPAIGEPVAMAVRRGLQPRRGHPAGATSPVPGAAGLTEGADGGPAGGKRNGQGHEAEQRARAGGPRAGSRAAADGLGGSSEREVGWASQPTGTCR